MGEIVAPTVTFSFCFSSHALILVPTVLDTPQQLGPQRLTDSPELDRWPIINLALSLHKFKNAT